MRGEPSKKSGARNAAVQCLCSHGNIVSVGVQWPHHMHCMLRRGLLQCPLNTNPLFMAAFLALLSLRTYLSLVPPQPWPLWHGWRRWKRGDGAAWFFGRQGCMGYPVRLALHFKLPVGANQPWRLQLSPCLFHLLQLTRSLAHSITH